MFKYIWTVAVLILVGAVAFFWLIKAPIISSYLTSKMGVQVFVRSIGIWPSETNIGHFRIVNPHGFTSNTAFEVDKTKINYRWKALMHDPCEIDLITLDTVYLNIDLQNATASDNNWSAIGAQMPKQQGGKEVIIHKLILRNMTVKTEGPGAKSLGVTGTQHFDQMVFEEIDSRHGFPTKELIARIFQGAGLRKFLENFLNPTQTIKGALQNPFKIFGEGSMQKKAPEENLEGT